jgi:hypothetical protein
MPLLPPIADVAPAPAAAPTLAQVPPPVPTNTEILGSAAAVVDVEVDEPGGDPVGRIGGEVWLPSQRGGGGASRGERVGAATGKNLAGVVHTSVNASLGPSNNNNNNNNKCNRTRSKPKAKAHPKRWSASEDEALLNAKNEYPNLKWKAIAKFVTNRTEDQCYQHWTSTLNPDRKKRQCSKAEKSELENLYRKHGKHFTIIAAESNLSYDTVHCFFNTRRGKAFRKSLDDSGLPRKRKAISSSSSSSSKQDPSNNNAKKNKTSELKPVNIDSILKQLCHD